MVLILAYVRLASADIIITEVMYNPDDSSQCPDTNCEWIELHNDGDDIVNLSGWKIDDHIFEDAIILPNGYLILARELIDLNGGKSFEAYWGNNNSAWNSDDGAYNAADGYFSMKNSGEDTIILKNDLGEVMVSVDYSNSLGADGNGHTLEIYNGNWYESPIIGGTPGYETNHTAKNGTGIADNTTDGHTPPNPQNDTIDYTSIKINEVMYDPEGTDNNKEFIEIYSDDEIDLSDFIIGDSSSNDSLTLLQHQDSHYYLITEEGFNLSGIEASVYSAGSTIGNNLNTEDSLYLYYKNGTLLDNMSYKDDCESGYSLEYFNGNFFCSFYLGGTPGKPNSNRSQDYNLLSINEFLPNPIGDDIAPMPDGEFIELHNKGNNSADIAGYYLKDSFNHSLFIADTSTLNSTIIKAEGYLAAYTNGISGFLNNEGFEEIRLYDPEGNLIDKLSYAESKEGLSWSLVEEYWQYRLPTPNKANFEDEPEMESWFSIEKIEDLGSDDEAKFGDIVKVKFHVYKGDTNKKSIKMYIEDSKDRITKITQASLEDKFTNYSLTLPLQIYPNCNEKFDNGRYYVKLGWTSESEIADEFKIEVNGINMDNCDKIYVEKPPTKGVLEYNLIEYPESAEIGEEFQIMVELTNNDGIDHVVDLYSYVYRGSKFYSISKEANKKKVLVKSGETKEFSLSNLVKNAEPGQYKLKVRIKREDQKTEKEITKEITLENKRATESTEKIAAASTFNSGMQGQSTMLSAKEQLVYESTDTKAKKLIPYFMITLFVTLLVILIIKNKERI